MAKSWSKRLHTMEVHLQRTWQQVTKVLHKRRYLPEEVKNPKGPVSRVLPLILSALALRNRKPGRSGLRRAEMKATQPLSAGLPRQGQPWAEGSREALTWKMGDGSFDLDKMDFLITEYETQNLWQIPEIQTGDAEERAHRTGLKGWWGRHNCFSDSPAYSLMCGTLSSILFSFRQWRYLRAT